ncbi:unnamed protein product [Darwinula stevensoni]|uniref:ZP domain-containing protein n=1 Tax=Darwinula stevensoni TaxID=69355 RepID=A0A7R9ABF6_9CRUS|nr:unnamed protein product [Darwinula stevensoni]CAG0899123.1 unnamed protein product [Darwinula stevensoni]
MWASLAFPLLVVALVLQHGVAQNAGTEVANSTAVPLSAKSLLSGYDDNYKAPSYGSNIQYGGGSYGESSYPKPESYAEPVAEYQPPAAYEPPPQPEYKPPPPKTIVYSPPVKILDCKVVCHGDYMVITFKFSGPFYGIVYPYGQYDCVVFRGQGETVCEITLPKNLCAGKGYKPPALAAYSSEYLRHHIMVQLDKNFVGAWDVHVIAKCDKPQGYQKKASFEFFTIDKQAVVLSGKLLGAAKLTYEILQGHGSYLRPLTGPVLLGTPLTLLFKLTEPYMEIDMNIVSCWAVEGKPSKQFVQNPNYGATSPEIQVISNGCSTQPKIFENSVKNKDGGYGGSKAVTTQIPFQAFRFPRSDCVIIRCEIQICYGKCAVYETCPIYKPEEYQLPSYPTPEAYKAPSYDSSYPKPESYDTYPKPESYDTPAYPAPSGYGSVPSYGGQSNYAQPNSYGSGYNAPPSSYSAPYGGQSGYAAPESGYKASPGAYPAPKPSYSAPSNTFSPISYGGNAKPYSLSDSIADRRRRNVGEVLETVVIEHVIQMENPATQELRVMGSKSKAVRSTSDVLMELGSSQLKANCDKEKIVLKLSSAKPFNGTLSIFAPGVEDCEAHAHSFGEVYTELSLSPKTCSKQPEVFMAALSAGDFAEETIFECQMS